MSPLRKGSSRQRCPALGSSGHLMPIEGHGLSGLAGPARSLAPSLTPFPAVVHAEETEEAVEGMAASPGPGGSLVPVPGPRAAPVRGPSGARLKNRLDAPPAPGAWAPGDVTPTGGM